MTEQVAAPAAAAAPAAPAAPAAAPAAATAPAAPAAPAPATASNDPAPVAWTKTGDAGLDMALDFIGQRGFGQQHPAVTAAMQGDFGLLRAQLASMGDKALGYEAYVALAEKAYADEVKKQTAQEEKAIGAVLDVVGSPEAWQEIHAWAKANADDDEKAEINAMLAGTPRQAKAAAIYLKECYERASGTSVQPASAIKPNAPARSGAAPAGGAITDAREYARLVGELHTKLGSKMEASPEYQQLQARRLQGRRIAR